MLPDWLYNSELLAGGWIIAAIGLLSCLMWVLILERYWFLLHLTASASREVQRQWQRCHGDNQRIKQRLRSGLVASYRQRLISSLGTIQVITAILPLLGLLGTVSGMIRTFEVMTLFGNGNIRGMADGISQALITTMAGLLTALSGMYFASNLQTRINNATEQLSEQLSLDKHEALARAASATSNGATHS